MIKKDLSFTRKIHRRLFIFVLVAGIFYILNPYVAHADVFGYEVPDLYADITENVQEVNDILKRAFQIADESPYDLLKGYAFHNADTIHTASKTAGLVVAVLLLMVDFFRKSVHFEWSSKWENILIFLVKVIVVKQLVQNVDVIIGHLYALCEYMNKKACGGDVPKFLPCDDMRTYTYHTFEETIRQATMPWWSVLNPFNSKTPWEDGVYKVSAQAVHLFYPDAKIPANETANWEIGTLFKTFLMPNKRAVFNPTIEKIFLYPYFLFMKIIAYYVIVVVIGRTFELCVYTLLAPLPLATLASEVASDTAKNFIRNYMACGLQVTVIATFFSVYSCMMSNMGKLQGMKFVHIVLLASLALAVSRSGDWSRRLCGAS